MAYDRVGSETMPMTHEFLASMLGVRRAGVTATAGELQRAGLITYRQRSITIRDPEGLVALACECYGIDHARYNRMRRPISGKPVRHWTATRSGPVLTSLPSHGGRDAGT
jgi:hypothetical protein